MHLAPPPAALRAMAPEARAEAGARRMEADEARGALEAYDRLLAAGEPSGVELRATEAQRSFCLDGMGGMQECGFSGKLSLEIPAVGLGTWKLKGDACRDAVLSALRLGYRHIDCADVYGNQREVGEAIAQAITEGVVRREDLFITGKLFPKVAPWAVETALRATLAELGVGYLDLWLLHWPLGEHAPVADVWSEMARFKDAFGSDPRLPVRMIGVSNFSVAKLEALPAPKPIVNQVEMHPHWRQDELLAYCERRAIHITAYGPLGSGDQWSADGLNRQPSGAPPMGSQAVRRAALLAGCSQAQALLAWAIARGVSVVPKSGHAGRQAQNLAVGRGFRLPTEAAAALGDDSLEQYRLQHGAFHTGPGRQFATLAELWDEDPAWAEGRDFPRPSGFRLR